MAPTSASDAAARSASPEVIGVGIVGLGFMGRTHLDAYTSAISAGAQAKLVAVADPDPDRRAGNPSAAGNIGAATDEPLFDPTQVRGYEHPEQMFADDRIDLVSICTPTDTHIPLATAALHAGKHVLLEKPVALTEAPVRELAELASRLNRVCMPAMCMRFWPEWVWLKAAIDDHRFGPVLAARFERLGSAPTWGQAFYQDMQRSGGALFDFHVHDADFIVHAFGLPLAVDARGDRGHVATTYRFADGPAAVAAEAGWLRSPHFPFRMRYTVEFERGVADFDLTREQPLLVHTAEGTETPKVAAGTGYDGEIAHAIRAARSGTQPSPSLHDAADVIRMLEAEARSLDSKQPVTL